METAKTADSQPEYPDGRLLLRDNYL